MQYIESLPNDRFVLIINDCLRKKFISNVHHLRQRWIKQYPKIKSFIVKFDELISQIRSYQEQSSQIKINEPLSIKFFCKNNELNDNFIYSQLLNDYLLQIKSISNRQNELNIICEFENDCPSNRTLWWYTRETFIYHLLNEAFRIQNIDVLLIFQFFIHDVQQLIIKNKCTKSLC
ncbi:unnamed protein product [Rotaria sordida]|uniref:Uncharacterized protein n=1 Tax=Rotaria sordida TaxID=392033 RepID=A0A815JD36_9BILA|nr:unnamed protein product [Rotaria sordida]CAF1614027.1 unnamed protein product [Rotaria sordida]